MSANESTPAVSLREARQREGSATAAFYGDSHSTVFAYNEAVHRLTAARRATDEALVRAVLRLCGYSGLDTAAVLDAVEREEA